MIRFHYIRIGHDYRASIIYDSPAFFIIPRATGFLEAKYIKEKRVAVYALVSKDDPRQASGLKWQQDALNILAEHAV